MGTCWAVFDDGHRTYFNWGKGMPDCLYLYDDETPAQAAYANPLDYAQAIREAENAKFAQWRGRLDDLKKALTEHIEDARIISLWELAAERMYDFCEAAGWQNLRLRPDTSDAYFELIEDEGYRQTGSRFDDDQPEPLVLLAQEVVAKRNPS